MNSFYRIISELEMLLYCINRESLPTPGDLLSEVRNKVMTLHTIADVLKRMLSPFLLILSSNDFIGIRPRRVSLTTRGVS
jgi:hypothetical protein